jgi:hypothetical protein
MIYSVGKLKEREGGRERMYHVQKALQIRDDVEPVIFIFDIENKHHNQEDDHLYAQEREKHSMYLKLLI